MNYRVLGACSLVAAVASACTWVKPVYEAKDVALVKPAHIVQCKKVGSTNSSVPHKITFIPRGKKKVAEELLTLAKNEAVRVGGDTLVADGPGTQGNQNFLVYKCSK